MQTPTIPNAEVSIKEDVEDSVSSNSFSIKTTHSESTQFASNQSKRPKRESKESKSDSSSNSSEQSLISISSKNKDVKLPPDWNKTTVHEPEVDEIDSKEHSYVNNPLIDSNNIASLSTSDNDISYTTASESQKLPSTEPQITQMQTQQQRAVTRQQALTQGIKPHRNTSNIPPKLAQELNFDVAYNANYIENAQDENIEDTITILTADDVSTIVDKIPMT